MNERITRIRMKDKVLEADDRYAFVNPEDAPNSRYAGVVVVKGTKPPYDIVFTESPIIGLSYEEEDKLIHRIADILPAISIALDYEVKPEFDSDGNILNLDAWKRSPKIGLFPIPLNQAEFYKDAGLRYENI